MENKTRIPHRICGKSLSVVLSAAMIASVGAVATVGVSALSISKDEVKNHTVGITGAFAECETWTKDIPMTDNGDGTYSAKITGQQPGEYEFKVRLDNSWNYSWGDYEWEDPNGDPADRTMNSQHNCKVTVTAETDVIKVTFDTTKISDDALAEGSSVAHELSGADDEFAYNFWPVTYEIVDGSAEEPSDEPIDEPSDEPSKEYEVKTYEDFRYVVLNDGNVAIVGHSGNNSSRNVVIPSEIEGRTVTEIKKYGKAPIIFDNVHYSSIVIPSSITKIDDSTELMYAAGGSDQWILGIFCEAGSAAEEFAKNKGYNYGIIPSDAVTSENYIYTVLDDGRIEINKYTGNEKNINVPSEIDGKKVKQICDHSFAGCDAESVTIPGTIEFIGDYSFQGSRIKKATIENGVKDIGVGAFKGSNLTDVSIPDTATVSSVSFALTPWYNNQTDEFVIVGDHTLIKYNGNGGNIKIPDGVKIISSIFTTNNYDNLHYNDTVTGIEIPDSVEELWGDAFAGCVNLKEIVIPDSVTLIGGGVFWNCTSLEKVYIPESVTAMNYDDTFRNCEKVSIYGVKGSTAEKYAKDHDIPFVEWVRNNNNNNSENSNTNNNNTNNNNNNNNTNNNTNNGNNNATNNNDVPPTGDNSFAMSAVIAMAVSGAVVLLAKNRKKKAE